MKIALERPKSEFEVQAEAITLLKEVLGEKYIVRGEYAIKRLRFDIAIFRSEDRELVCTIEIKKSGGTRKHQKQLSKYYWATGKPCILLTQHTMHSAVRALKNRLGAS